MQYRPVKFPRGGQEDFWRVLRSNVNQHFVDKGISQNGDYRMYLKTAVMLSLYIVPFVLMLTGVISNPWLVLGLWLIMGAGKAGIGMSVMHDANHGAYSSNPNVNRFMGYMLNIVGGLALNWKVQHNKLHHSFTNIEGHDEDIAPVGVLRFSPHAEWKPMHKYQYIYAWFFYGLMTLSWVLNKDFKQLFDYKKRGLLGRQTKNFSRFLALLIFQKVAYYLIVLGLPIMLTDIPVWQLIGGFLLMHFAAGTILASVFQLAHVMPETEYPLPSKELEMENQWAIHQLQTTTNFAPGRGILSYYVGGLNHQVEHHLFPNICHIHYPDIAPIVERTAKEYGVPYHSIPSFGPALKQHVQMLRNLGKKEYKQRPAPAVAGVAV